MKQSHRPSLCLLILLSSLLTITELNAQTRTPEQDKASTNRPPSLQRVPTEAFENLSNKVSNVELNTTNSGVIHLSDIHATGIWPRGSGHRYIFGGSIWFGAIKLVDGIPTKMVDEGYAPNTGNMLFVPGRLTTATTEQSVDSSAAAISKYRIYNSIEYDPTTGMPLDPTDSAGPNWPIWSTASNRNSRGKGYLGTFIDDVTKRHANASLRKPTFISDEDIVSTYHDGDLSRLGIANIDSLRANGQPIGLQIEQTIYGWETGEARDFLIISYAVINTSGNDLLDCYVGPMIDPDIDNPANDYIRLAIPEKNRDSLDLGVAWSEPELNGRQGYFGLDLLSTPAIDPTTGFIRHDKSRFDRSEQLGLTAFRQWFLQQEDEVFTDSYGFMATRNRDTEMEPNDKRMMMVTGPFNMHPNDTAHIAIGLIFAYGVNENPTGTWSDMKNLLALDAIAQRMWDAGLVRSGTGVEDVRNLTSENGLAIRPTVFPNPVTASTATTISFDLPTATNVEFRLYDPMGRQIEQRDLGYLQGNGNSIRVDCSALSAGLYTYEIRTVPRIERGSITVVR